MMTTQQERRTKLVHLIATIAETDVASVRGEQRLREDLGMDSLGALELLSTVSEALSIDLDVEDAMDLRTVDDAARFVEKSYLEQHDDSVARA